MKVVRCVKNVSLKYKININMDILQIKMLANNNRFK